MPFFACLAQPQPDSVFRRAGLLVCMLLLGTGQRSAVAALEPLSDIVAISETCALDAAGDIWCWGYNTGVHDPQHAGYLFHPTRVLGLPEPTVKVISNGLTHCSIDTQQALRCWGANSAGQAGAGAASTQAPIGLVAGIGNVAILHAAVGGSHACAVTTAGAVGCWGSNNSGELGLPLHINQSLSAVTIDLPLPALQVSVGAGFSCALLEDSQVWCWGSNWAGQLGDGSLESSVIPRLAGSGFQQLASHQMHTCALGISNTLHCWGSWIYDAESDSMAYSSGPLDTNLNDVVGFSLAAESTCAVLAGGDAVCWGRNADGALGSGDFVGRAQPTAIQGNHTFVAVSGRCGLRHDSQVWCWGRNDMGQLGDGSPNRIPHPTPVNLSAGPLQQIALGQHHSCVSDDLGAVQCWGANTQGELGTGDHRQALQPVDSLLAVPAAGLFAASSKTCAIASAGTRPDVLGNTTTLHCWGGNRYGELGAPTNPAGDLLLPTHIESISSPVHTVALGERHACVSSDFTATVQCSGSNDSHQGCREDSFAATGSFTHCFGPNGAVQQLSASSEHSCVVTTEAQVLCWGSNSVGQLGTGDVGLSTPLHTAPSGLDEDIVEVATGEGFTCVRRASGEVWCWGSNSYGALGDGTSTLRPLPQAVANLPPAAQLVAAGNTVCARSTTDDLYCWGRNSSGQLGDGSFAHRYSPTWISSIGSVRQIALSADHACAIQNDGDLYCWGDNSYGELGIGSANRRSVPGPVLREVEDSSPFLGFADGFEGN